MSHDALRHVVRSLVVAAGLAVTISSNAAASSPTQQQRSAFGALRADPSGGASDAVARLVDSRLGRVAGVDAKHVYRVPAPAGRV